MQGFVARNVDFRSVFKFRVNLNSKFSRISHAKGAPVPAVFEPDLAHVAASLLAIGLDILSKAPRHANKA